MHNLSLRGMKARFEELDEDFRQVPNVSLAKAREMSIILDFIRTVSSGTSKSGVNSEEILAMANYLNDTLRFVNKSND